MIGNPRSFARQQTPALRCDQETTYLRLGVCLGNAFAISPLWSVMRLAGSRERELTYQTGVLVVEDEPLIVMDLRAMAEGAGYRVIGLANSVEAAHRLTAQENPHLTLLDVNLGRSNVIEIADALAVIGTLIIFVTAHSRTVWQKLTNTAQSSRSRLCPRPCRPP